MEFIELKISGLKCDTPHCNYRDDDITFEDYPNHINEKCPVCSSNLLTQADYDQCLKEYSIVDKLNKVSKIINYINPLTYIRKIKWLKIKEPKMINTEFYYENDGTVTKTEKIVE